MTVGTVHTNWQIHTPAPDRAYSWCSPNLEALFGELGKRWGFTDLGCYGWRTIRAGTEPSSHGFGAARDMRYGEIGRARALTEVLPWLIDNSGELHIGAIHDYIGCRIWHAGRTPDIADAHTAWWKDQPANPANGMGQSWPIYFHVETTEDGWVDGTPIPNRGSVPTPVPPPAPLPIPGGFMPATIRKGSPPSADVELLQTILRLKASQPIVIDGGFGSQTDTALRNLQRISGLVVDGICGPATWAVALGLANS